MGCKRGYGNTFIFSLRDDNFIIYKCIQDDEIRVVKNYDHYTLCNFGMHDIEILERSKRSKVATYGYYLEVPP